MIANHIHKYYAEATFHVLGSKDDYDYVYITYDKSKLKGFQIKNIGKYNIQAWATIPITENGFVNMRLFIGKDDRIVEFTMQYRDLVNCKGILGNLNIRSDYGHGTKDPHIDIELLDQSGKKKALDENGNRILDKKVIQSDNFLNYEAAINAVFMQVEKYNPSIGAKYWLSPFGVHDKRVDILSELRNQSGISTSLTILARLMNVKLYEATEEKQADMNYFREIAETQLHLCKEKEQEYGGALDISEVKYSTEMSVLPFLLFVPVIENHENAYYDFKRYSSDGTEINIKPVAIVLERKRENEITRGLTSEEKRVLNNSSKENVTLRHISSNVQ